MNRSMAARPPAPFPCARADEAGCDVGELKGGSLARALGCVGLLAEGSDARAQLRLGGLAIAFRLAALQQARRDRT